MRKVSCFVLLSLIFCISAAAQSTDANGATSADDAKPKTPVFRPTKAQITQVQEMLKSKGVYNGSATGKYDTATRAAIRIYQKDNGLKSTGTLNRATLEKMGVELTDSQKQIPISPNSYASNETSEAKTVKTAATTSKPKKVIFSATKGQITEAQEKLISGGMLSGEATGKLDPATRAGLKKYQEMNSLKVTGTLNQATLEKMGIELTEKQKENATSQN